MAVEVVDVVVGSSATAFAMSYFGPNQFERVTAGSSSGTATFTHNVLGVGVRTIGTSTDYDTRDERKQLVSQRLPGGARHYYLFDGLGSIVALTDSTGAVGRRHSYDPYGLTSSSGTTANPWRYADAYQDSGSTATNGLYKMGMRYYDPNVGSWIQQDPLDQTGDLRQGNRYIYAASDPINVANASGLHGAYIEGSQARAAAPIARTRTRRSTAARLLAAGGGTCGAPAAESTPGIRAEACAGVCAGFDTDQEIKIGFGPQVGISLPSVNVDLSNNF